MAEYRIQSLVEAKTTLIEVVNDAKMRVTLCTNGASIFNLEVEDKPQHYVPLVISNHTIDDFKMNPQYFGKSVGRVAGRIPLSKFELNDKTYQLDSNNHRHCLHGGFHGFSFQEFAYEISENDEAISVAFGYFSPNMEGGFPGNLTVSIIYHIAKKSPVITIDFHALSDEDTLVNLTNHSYFNLSGNVTTPVLDHLLTIKASHYTKVDDEIIVQAIEPVNPVMDFRAGKPVGKDLFDPSIYLTGAKGYDHCFILDDTKGQAQLSLVDPVSKRSMHIETTYPAIVVYSDNYPRPYPLQGGAIEVAHAGLAIEAQYIPGNLSMMTLKQGVPYFHQIRYKFGQVD